MKILLYSMNYSPELTGIGKYTGEMAEWLAGQGHEVRVVTAPPYYPKWIVFDGYINWYSKDYGSGVKVYRCPLYVPRNPSGLLRILHLSSFALSSFPVIIRHILWRPDLVFVVEPTIFCSPAALLLARFTGGKSCLHVQDLEIDAAFSLGIVKLPFLKKLILFLESWLMGRFDLVSTISRSMAEKLMRKSVVEPFLFPNWVDFAQVKFDQNGRKAMRKELDVSPGQCMCLYSGNIAEKQGLDILIDVAESLPEIRIIICGDGAKREDLEFSVRHLGLENITFLPLQPQGRFSALLSAADIHLVIQKSGASDLVLPSKLTNILAVGGLALVTADRNTELGRLAEGEGACIYRCDPEDPASLIEAVRDLCEHVRDDLREKAVFYARNNLDKHKVLRNLEKKLLQVCAAR